MTAQRAGWPPGLGLVSEQGPEPGSDWAGAQARAPPGFHHRPAQPRADCCWGER